MSLLYQSTNLCLCSGRSAAAAACSNSHPLIHVQTTNVPANDHRVHPPAMDPLRRELSLIARSHMNSKCADCRGKGESHARHRIAPPAEHQLKQVLPLVFFFVNPAPKFMDPYQIRSGPVIEGAEGRGFFIATMSTIGNLKFNAKYEAKLKMHDRILADADRASRQAFIHAKYITRTWYDESPSTEEMESDSSFSSSPVAPVASPSPSSDSSDASVAPIGRAEKRRIRAATAAKICPAEMEEMELRKLKEKEAERKIFDPLVAQRAAEQLFAASTNQTDSTNKPSLPPLNSQLSFLLTTSAIPSNPSLELIEGVLSSCEANIGLDRRKELPCLTIIIMDGYMYDERSELRGTKPLYKNGKLDDKSIRAYEEFKLALRSHIASQPYPHLFLVPLELPFRHGFAGAVHEAMRFISTPLMMVMQHDWCFIRRLQHSVWQLCDLMIRETPTYPPPATEVPVPPITSSTSSAATTSPISASPIHLPINYITFQASTTLRYLEKDFHFVKKDVGPEIFKLHSYSVVDSVEGRANPQPSIHTAASSTSSTDTTLASPAGASSSDPTAPITLCPVFFWFDRNHLVRTSFYRDWVFGAYRFMRSASFIEDTFGQLMLNMLRGTREGKNKNFKPKTFDFYASFIYYQDGGKVPDVDHVHGRKFITQEQRVLQYGEREQTSLAKAEEKKVANEQWERENESTELALDEMYLVDG